MTERATVGEATDVAFQKLCRDRYLDEGTPDVPHLKVKRAMVRRVSRSVATRLILKYEWLGTMAGTSAHYGIFFGDHCAGVCCVALGGSGAAGAFTHKQFGIDRRAFATFARGACVHWAPKGTNSKLISWTLRLLAKDCPTQKLVIAYADSDAGEIGTVYQATNWTFIGRSVVHTKRELVSPEGRVMNTATAGSYARRNRMRWCEMVKAMEAEGWTQQKPNPKGRYVYVLDSTDAALVDLVASLAKPYPKRDNPKASESSTTPASQSGSGRGSTDPDAPDDRLGP
jgi:hypothetical protein